jgi:hypothetical protein
MVANIMLALHCKKTEAIDLKTPIWEYISNTYSVDQVPCRASVTAADGSECVPEAAHIQCFTAVSMQLQPVCGWCGRT